MPPFNIDTFEGEIAAIHYPPAPIDQHTRDYIAERSPIPKPRGLLSRLLRLFFGEQPSSRERIKVVEHGYIESRDITAFDKCKATIAVELAAYRHDSTVGAASRRTAYLDAKRKAWLIERLKRQPIEETKPTIIHSFTLRRSVKQTLHNHGYKTAADIYQRGLPTDLEGIGEKTHSRLTKWVRKCETYYRGQPQPELDANDDAILAAENERLLAARAANLLALKQTLIELRATIEAKSIAAAKALDDEL